MNNRETTYTELLEAAVCQGATIKQILADIDTLRRLKKIAVMNSGRIKIDNTIAKELYELPEV